MYRNFLLFLGVFGICLSAYLYKTLIPKKTLITPYPYFFSENYIKNYPLKNAEAIKKAESSKILIVGDHMGVSLDPYLPGFLENFNKTLKTPPTIYNWSEKNEGLHRTLFKLKQLKKLPPLILYFGASSELFEKTFNVEDKNALFYNFNQYDNEKIISAIITFPVLSKYFYKSINYIELEDFTDYKSMEASSLKLAEKEVSFKLFEYQIKELIEYVKEQKSQLIFMTTPINLLSPPKEVCAHASSDQIVEYQQELEKELNEGAFKVVYPKILELSDVTFSNAKTFYLLGVAAQGVGDQRLARESLLKANAFDCLNWRGSSIYNSIIKKHAQKNHLELIDFEQLMSSNLNSESFFDELYPQNIYYQNIMSELTDVLNKILKLNQ